MPSSTRSTCAASPTATATASVTWPASAPGSRYLRDLGVDAVWFNPWYVSPMADGGYDVADYRAIEPAFGTLAEAEALIPEALDLGIRTIVDIVPNHVSDQHAGSGRPSLPDRARRCGALLVPSGRGTAATAAERLASQFGDTAWTRTRDPDGTPGEWYLHLFSPGQPDLNWPRPEVRREHEDMLRFWFERGAAGVRIDSAALAIKNPACRARHRGGPAAPVRGPGRAPRRLPVVAARSPTSTGPAS